MDDANQAPCPKCHRGMIFVAAMPHPRAPALRKTTFVCYPCNRTFSYNLAAEAAQHYAPDTPHDLSA